ncbi:MAG: hypothetical protein KDB07_10680, partial [Planctomycetes bacterium]|nr:hypothetical protein [Planctomycetota bacterium]
QYDSGTMATTTGEATTADRDFGNWRNQEVAGLHNVLAMVTTGHGGVNIDVSLDRGGSFAITEELSAPGLDWGQRLCNIDISDDYTIGVIYWRTTGSTYENLMTELVLVEGTPTGFDGNNTPTGYAFGSPVVVHTPDSRDAIPLLMQLEYSSAGDLVIGYGYNEIAPVMGMPFTQTEASFRCAVRPVGGEFNDVLIDSETGTIPNDPSVALRGSGSTMEVFFAYERSDGVHLAYSNNGGANFVQVAQVGEPGAFQPSVHVRDQAGQVRVDVLFLNPTIDGLELHNMRWDSFDPSGAGVIHEALTQATKETIDDNTGQNTFMPFAKTVKIKDVAWFGFDAVTDGDDVVMVVHEQERTSFDFMNIGGRPVPGFPVFFGGGIFADAAGGSAGASSAPPQALLPGLTTPAGAPDAAHRNQLRLVKLD